MEKVEKVGHPGGGGALPYLPNSVESLKTGRMEGFECKLVSSASWPFDPLSQELLLLQKTPLEHSHNKLLAFSTLNLNTR